MFNDPKSTLTRIGQYKWCRVIPADYSPSLVCKDIDQGMQNVEDFHHRGEGTIPESFEAWPFSGFQKVAEENAATLCEVFLTSVYTTRTRDGRNKGPMVRSLPGDYFSG